MWPTSTSDRIREEKVGDEGGIAAVISAAFAAAPHSSGTEAAIVAQLRADGDLALSLVAEANGGIVGHAAFSPVTIDGADCGWFGLGPVSVLPERQGMGVGRALIAHGIERMIESGARGCVVLGEARYYGRFGFVHDPLLRYPGPPPEYFQRLVLAGAAPSGTVAYARGFAAAGT